MQRPCGKDQKQPSVTIEISRNSGEAFGFYAKSIEEAVISPRLSAFHLPTPWLLVVLGMKSSAWHWKSLLSSHLHLSRILAMSFPMPHFPFRCSRIRIIPKVLSSYGMPGNRAPHFLRLTFWSGGGNC